MYCSLPSVLTKPQTGGQLAKEVFGAVFLDVVIVTKDPKSVLCRNTLPLVLPSFLCKKLYRILKARDVPG